MRAPAPAMIALLNKCEPPAKPILHCVPTRVIRVTQKDECATTFNVEQLVEHSGFSTIDPKGAWRTLSVHTNPQEGAAFSEAMAAAWKAQKDLVARLKRRMAEQMEIPRNLRG